MKRRPVPVVPGLDRRGLLRVLVPLAAVHGLLIVAQAELLARTLAPPDTGPLPWLVAVFLLRAVVTGIGSARAHRTATAVKTGLRAALLRKGADSTLVIKGLDALDPYIAGYLPQLATACAVPPLVMLRLATVDLTSAVTVLVTLPLIPVFGALVGHYTRDATRLQWERLQRLGGHFRDVVAGISTLRAFGRTGHQEVEVERMAQAHRRATGRALRVAFLSALVLETVATLSVALVAVPIGLRLLNDGIDYRTALIVLLLTPEVYLPVRMLGSRYHAAAEGLAVADQVTGVLAGPGAPQSTRRARAIPPRGAPGGALGPRGGGWEMRLDEVTVRYGDQTALDRVSLVVRPGERLALTGPSGAGKSTVLAVLLGLVAPDEGRVLVDGQDLRTLDPAAWRRRLAWVPQVPHLFAASVADNVRLGAPEASHAAVQRALVGAHALEFVAALPAGRETVLGERGQGLSAGQRQRIALARAYLCDAPIVLLDEPTARLDPGSEAAVVDAARRLLRDRTAVLVAHRPALLAAADRVVRLRDGRVL